MKSASLPQLRHCSCYMRHAANSQLLINKPIYRNGFTDVEDNNVR